MGLAIEVGMLADLNENDQEGASWLKEDFKKLNTYLSKKGVEPHAEPDNCPVHSFDMFSYSGLHYLRRLAAHLAITNEMPPPGDDNAPEDPVLDEYFKISMDKLGFLDKLKGKKAKKLRFDHLIVHSDAEGYYLPIDFDEVLFPPADLDITGGMVGSSNKLLRECESLAQALDLPLDIDPESDELWEAADSQGKGSTTWKKYGIESFTCIRLHRAATLSIESGAAIVFC